MQQQQQQQLPPQLSSLSVTRIKKKKTSTGGGCGNTCSNTIRWFIIVGIYITVLIDLFVLWTEPFDDENTIFSENDDNNNNKSIQQNHKKKGPFSLLLQNKGLLGKVPRGKEYVMQLLQSAGVPEYKLMDKYEQLPTWEQIIDLYGDKPIILGLDDNTKKNACSDFRQRVVPDRDAAERMIGPAGMFSTGTNLLTQLLKENCYIPERLIKYGKNATKEQLGMRWQVPWGKHTPAQFKWNHSTQFAANVDKSAILPVVTIRNPYRWIQSMCKNSYSATWFHPKNKCPYLKYPNGDWNEVTVAFGSGDQKYKSLQHLWNNWYNEYYRILFLDSNNTTNNYQQPKESYYPLLMVRMEDLIFHTIPTITQVCNCAGGIIRTDRNFTYIQESAKANNPQAHDTSIGILEAFIKYSRPLEPGAGFTRNDYLATQDAIDNNLMNLFQYKHPKLPPP